MTDDERQTKFHPQRYVSPSQDLGLAGENEPGDDLIPSVSARPHGPNIQKRETDTAPLAFFTLDMELEFGAQFTEYMFEQGLFYFHRQGIIEPVEQVDNYLLLFI